MRQNSGALIRAAKGTGCWAAVALVLACEKPGPPHAPAVPLAQIEATFGPLIGAGNEPAPEQNGTGDRLGLFRGHDGTVWGLPLTVSDQRAVLGCAPASLHDASVTDTLPGDTREIVGAMNAPTGWRGGTGQLELLLRDARGELRWLAVRGRGLPTGPVCWEHRVPGLRQQLHYYRLAMAATSPQTLP